MVCDIINGSTVTGFLLHPLGWDIGVLVGFYAMWHPISVDQAFISATSDKDRDSAGEKGKLMPEVPVPVRINHWPSRIGNIP